MNLQACSTETNEIKDSFPNCCKDCKQFKCPMTKIRGNYWGGRKSLTEAVPQNNRIEKLSIIVLKDSI